MEEHIASAIVGTQKAKSFSFEICNHGSDLLPRSIRRPSVTGALSARAAGLVTDALLDQRQIIFGKLRNWSGLRRHLQIRILLLGFFK